MLKVTKLSAEIIDGDKTKKVISAISLTINPGEVHLLMGPNGAGKSSLAKALMGYPDLKATGSIKLDTEELSEVTPDIRSKAGLFISHQNPVEIPGVKLIEFLKTAYNEQREPKDRVDIWAFLSMFEKAIKEAGLPTEFSDRELNAGFSGGEKKKSEILQLIVLKPKYAILDEIDSGLDVDATKRIYETINKLALTSKIGFLVISHNPNVLEFIQPKKIHILKDGKIVESGGAELAEKIKAKGFSG